VVRSKSDYVSEEKNASIVTVEAQFFFLLGFTLVSFSAYFSTRELEAICPSKTSVDFEEIIRLCIPEYSTLHKVSKLHCG
jgi:hypothetical protein